MLYLLEIYVFSFIFIGIGIYKKYEHSKKKKIYKEITGIVVGHRERKVRRGIRYDPIIRYELGKLDYVFEYHGPTIKLGTKVEIMYNPNKPDEAIKKKDSNYIYYLFTGVMLFLSVLILTILFVNDMNI